MTSERTNTAQVTAEATSEKIRKGEPVGIMEALAAIEYQKTKKVIPWWLKDRFEKPMETAKGKPLKSAIHIIYQNIRKIA